MRKEEATVLLRASRGGEERAASEFFDAVYEELHAMAERFARRERSGHTLQPTALVHEVYLRLIDDCKIDWQDRNHFFGVAAVCIRRILGDHARKRRAAKRGGGLRRVSLVDNEPTSAAMDVALLDLDEALKKLAQRDARQARVIELRFFGGLTVDDCASFLGVSPRTVKSDWRFARAWLCLRLEGGGGE